MKNHLKLLLLLAVITPFSYAFTPVARPRLVNVKEHNADTLETPLEAKIDYLWKTGEDQNHGVTLYKLRDIPRWTVEVHASKAKPDQESAWTRNRGGESYAVAEALIDATFQQLEDSNKPKEVGTIIVDFAMAQELWVQFFDAVRKFMTDNRDAARSKDPGIVTAANNALRVSHEMKSLNDLLLKKGYSIDHISLSDDAPALRSDMGKITWSELADQPDLGIRSPSKCAISIIPLKKEN